MDESMIGIRSKLKKRIIYSDDSDEENSNPTSSDLPDHQESKIDDESYISESDEENSTKQTTNNSNFDDVHKFSSDDEEYKSITDQPKIGDDSKMNISTSSQNAEEINMSIPNESIIERLHDSTKTDETTKLISNIQDLSILNSSNEDLNSSITDNTDLFVAETDEEDFAMESRCFSPRTRQSIGIRNVSGYTSVSDSESEKEAENPSEMAIGIDEKKIEISPSKKHVMDTSVISLSSSDDETAMAITNTPKPKLIQQKITNYTPQRVNVKYVSQDLYDAELHEISEIKSNILKSKDLLKTLRHTLPDDGASLKLRISKLENNLQEKTDHLKTITVKQDDDDAEDQPKRKSKTSGIQNVVDDWSKITDAINAIQPVHTGKVGLNTFNTQKALTVDRLRQLHESLDTCPTENTLAVPPKGLRVDLMNHQKHALAWMIWREKQKPKGGILADDMGLGKTLTMISLVLEMRQREDNDDYKEDENSSDDDDDDDDNVKKNDQPNWAGRGRRPDIYQGGTLVVCPASLINQWEKEVENRIQRNLLAVCVHHGAKRDVKPKYLSKNDIVITTYAIVSRECKSHGPIFQIKWQRIILDEAHIIRNHKAQQSEACFQLKGSCRWTLTGTPIQNKEMDLFALLKFLRCSPFNDLEIYKKWIGNNSEGAQNRLNNLIKPLLLRRTKQKLQETGELEGLPTKNVIIVQVKLSKNEMNVYQRIMTYSKTLFSQFLHQRAAKENNMFYIDEGHKPAYLRSNQPNAAYDKMHKKMSQLRGTEDIRTHQILVYILRLRQICCHPGLIDAMLEDDNNGDEVNLTIPEIDLLEQLNKLDLNESDGVNTANKSNSFDTGAISKASSKLLLRSNPVFDLTRISAKLTAVMNLIENEILPLDEKAVIVSQWSSVLKILEKHLNDAKIPFVKLSGDVLVSKRNDLVVEFNNSTSKTKLMLLTLTAGGVGLNLVGGNHLLLVDPHWNPQLEAQAQDRVYRVGQNKPVKIYKFLCQETIEERINLLQDSKLKMANGLLNGIRHQGSSKLTLDDMKALFGM